jgi:hypothetical protein
LIKTHPRRVETINKINTMKNYVSVTVEVEYSASHIEKFHEKVNATCSAPLSQAICNVREKIKGRGYKYPYNINYSAY